MSVIQNEISVIPNKISVIPNKMSVIPNEVRDLGFAATAKRPTPRPISSIPIPKREARSPEHQKNKPVGIFRDPGPPVWVGHSCPTPLTSILDFAENEQDECSTVEERRFSAA
jgi:hypothetical protein